jgi:chorismate mutase/prephenate dehydratase
MDDLGRLRAELDRLDRQLVETLRARLDTVADIVRVKAEGLPFLRDHERESQLLERSAAWARELGLDPFRTQEVFREVVAMSLKAQEEALLARERVERSSRAVHRAAYQGTLGSYSHLAATKYFAACSVEMDLVGMASFAAALEAAERGEVAYAVLPIENTTAGSINQTYDLLLETPLAIVGEEVLQVRHCLLGLPGATLGGVRRVLSHPQGLAQCSQFLAGRAGIEQVAFGDTAAAASEVAKRGDPTVAAIASAEAGARYGLEVLERGVADQDENWTRFVVVSSLPIELDPRIPAKTSLVFTTPHRHGALAHCLTILERHDLNLTKLESRPIPRRPWEYRFYVDLEGGLISEEAALAIAELRRECPSLRVLGSYPARTTAGGAVDRMHGGG